MENLTIYSVLVLRKDKDHLTIIETENYDEAYESWKKIQEMWVSNLSEQKAFVLEKPIVTAFDPGLIYEIKIVPYSVSKSHRNNPYHSEMKTRGLEGSLGRFTNANDLLDGGYKS
jgi:hypothetical protein